ncbi:phospholipase D-like domain-containing protein [Algoriphagus limi]|uniref:phospholipase D n=1 Tax=Algoriphagus limi TaxID=2975273 RepID=A0ABT2G1B0_9BACT|nr:phospholipase D-like domain-containing protein [Algoriphagus limi]MCS5488862.1 phospholipase D-like domain-containing protein [Algoriphagus limi]
MDNYDSFNSNQDFIFDNQEIFDRLSMELNKAEKTIKVAAAWFTDPDLLEILVKKAKEGVSVDVIISDNVNNEKLDFSELTRSGGEVLKVKNTGYGMMHQKYCIIDNRIAIHGSYNWSVNARTNNDESITITDIPSMVNKMNDHFEKIKSRGEIVSTSKPKGLKAWINNLISKPNGFDSSSNEEQKENEDSFAEQSGASDLELNQEEKDKLEYQRVLDSMIAAEVSDFDRQLLKQEGYERSRLNNGDHQILSSALDSVYSVFINEINVVEDKKNRLKSKINEHEVRTIDAANEKFELNKKTLEVQFSAKEENIIKKSNTIASIIESLRNNIKKIHDIEIKEIERKKEVINQKIKEIEIQFVKPALRWFELIPFSILFFGILGYLIVFYSSAAYILIFSEADAKTAELNGAQILPPDIFNPDAINLSLDKGFGGIAIVFLFVFIPLSLSLIDVFLTDLKKSWAFFWSLFLIILVDVFIAFRVAKSIHEIKYLSGQINEPWEGINAFSDVNFYLVFILGALGLLMFKLIYKKLISFFEERNPDIDKQQKKKIVTQLKDEIEDLNLRIKEFNNQIAEKEDQIIFHENEVNLLDTVKGFLPSQKAMAFEKLETELNLKIQNIKSITAIYLSHIDNDKLPISMDSINDRINIYLEGWSNYLHEIYAIRKATEMAQFALDEARKWKEDKIQKKLIDFRIIK